jgi:glucose/arabinose dehydrogenase
VFLDITSLVLSGGERGLLGLAFHPGYATNRRFFVNYTRRPDGATVVAEYRASASNPDVADVMETRLLLVPQPYANHNGGMIEFGPDGFLYIALGDGGSSNDPENRAQNVNDLLGKLLRIDVNTGPDCPPPYCSPPDNPFFGSAPGRDEIFALGLRNPWRFSFDRQTGALLVADVGQGVREEINLVTPGGNYGWRVFEGTRCTDLDPASCSAGGFTPPIQEYEHSAGRCSITGGYVYRGTRSSLPEGAYIYGDFCTGEIWQLSPPASGGTNTLLLNTSRNISSFGEDEAGEIYVVGLGGTLDRLTTGNLRP